MKRILFSLIIASLLLCSCRPLENIEEDTDTEIITGVATTAPGTSDTTDTTKEETTAEPILPCLIGFYDDLNESGTYTRLESWKAQWIAGRDIAVFDIIPSTEDELISRSYKNLWKSEAEKLGNAENIKPYFSLRFTLRDGSEKSYAISSYKDAESITDEGYLEVYLYDDIHQEDGAWYYHLTEQTTNADTVISSFKLTAGKMIDSVSSISLSVSMEGSSEAVIEIYKS